MVLAKLVRNCSGFFPIKGRTQVIYLLEAFSITSFFIKTLSKYFLHKNQQNFWNNRFFKK